MSLSKPTKAELAERAEAIARLREWLKPGDTVYTVLRSVSRSGMSREIDLRKVDADGSIMWLSGMAARAMGDRLGKRDGIIAGGCGMDMGFALVYNLSRVLFADGFGCIGDGGEGGRRRGCPSNDHPNGSRDYTPHGICADCKEDSHTATPGHEYHNWHRNGGYALRHAWI